MLRKERVKVFLAVLVVSMAFLSMAPAHAAWAINRQIDELKIQTSGLALKLRSFANTDSSVSCATDNFFLPSDDPLFKERMAFLLAAHASGRSVNVSYYGCFGEHIRISSVAIL